MTDTDHEEIRLLRDSLTALQNFMEAQKVYVEDIEARLVKVDPEFAALQRYREMKKNYKGPQ